MPLIIFPQFPRQGVIECHRNAKPGLKMVTASFTKNLCYRIVESLVWPVDMWKVSAHSNKIYERVNIIRFNGQTETWLVFHNTAPPPPPLQFVLEKKNWIRWFSDKTTLKMDLGGAFFDLVWLTSLFFAHLMKLSQQFRPELYTSNYMVS